MQRALAALTALSLGALLACSAHYEVGAMDGQPPAGGSTGQPSQTSNAGTPTMMVAMGIGATGTAGPSMPASECLSTEAPSALEGDFAEPSVVWSRIQTLIWGGPHEAPKTLPKTATYAWAADVALQGLRQALADSGGVPGSVPFILDWFRLDKDSELLSQHYPVLFGNETNVVLEQVLPAMLTEPAWLAQHASISSRGAGISLTLLEAQWPDAPAGAHDVTLDDALQDRAALAAVLNHESCAACHAGIDPLGYALGNFDGLGRYRDLDHGAPLDLTGSYTLPLTQGHLEYDGLADFAAKLAASCDATLALADSFLRFGMAVNGVEPGEAGDATFEANRSRFRQAFVQGGRTYPALVQAYAQSPYGIRP